MHAVVVAVVEPPLTFTCPERELTREKPNEPRALWSVSGRKERWLDILVALIIDCVSSSRFCGRLWV